MSVITNEILQHYQNSWQEHFSGKDSDCLQALRQAQLAAFLRMGFPTHKNEQWKYTNLDSLAKQRLQPAMAPSQSVEKEEIDEFLLSSSHYRLVFIDGKFNDNCSLLPNSGALTVTNLAQAIENNDLLLQQYLPQINYQSAFVHLNGAYLKDGALIHVSANCQIDRPIHLLYLNSNSHVNNLQTVRNLVLVEANAQLSLLEEHQPIQNHNDQNIYLMNSVTQVFANANSQIEYSKLQHQSTHSFHIALTEILQKKHSRVFLNHYSLGSQIAREDIHCLLAQEGAVLQLQGLYFPRRNQHIDVQTHIHHLADHTTSETFVKGVIAGRSRAVFNGQIVVEKNIKHAVANLQNKNLLLALDAQVNTKPELRIFSDEVKCKHGATIGQVDKEMLFYLRSRGMDEEQAYQLLLLAFVALEPNTIAAPGVSEKILKYVTNYCEVVK